MNEDKESERIRKVRKAILKSGYPTEIEVRNALKKNGWLVGNQWPYRDKTTQKVRAVDVFAMKIGLKPSRLGIILLAECKKSEEHEWVFYTQQKEADYLSFMGAIFDTVRKVTSPQVSEQLEQLMAKATLGDIFNIETRSSNILSKLSGLHILNRSIRMGLFSVAPFRKDGGKDDFFEATQQIISSIESLAEGMKGLIVFPLIVFEGEVYEFYPDDGELTILPTNHVQFISFGADLTPHLIDIVKKSHLAEFLKMIETDLQILSEIANYGAEKS